MADTPNPPAGAAGSKNAPVMVRPFITGTRERDDYYYDNTTLLTASVQKLPTFELNTEGFTSKLYILCETTAVNTTASTTGFTYDGPFNVYSSIQFSDTNNKPILGPMTGHDFYQCVKYGGYAEVDDAKASVAYSVSSGTGTAGGTFTFILPIPIEIVHRDALGAQVNKNASAVWKLDMTLNTNATVSDGSQVGFYTDNPTTSVSVRTRVAQFGWMDSAKRDVKGNPASEEPPGLSTRQIWDKQSFTLAAGNFIQKLNSFSGGMRTLIWELRDSNGSRTANEGDWPDPFTFQIDTSIPVNRLRVLWRHLITEYYRYWQGLEVAPGVSGTAATEGLRRDYGVYPLTYARDFGLRPGAESRFGYEWVTAATALMAKGTIGGSGSHTMNVFVNYVIPAGGDPKALTGNR